MLVKGFKNTNAIEIENANIVIKKIIRYLGIYLKRDLSIHFDINNYKIIPIFKQLT